MREHHKQSLENLIQVIKEDENNLAVIIAGSIARGTERENSDIDVYIVVTDEDFKRRSEENNTTYSTSKVCTYAGGYIDGKIIDMGFLRAAADHGSEPARHSFAGSYAVWSRVEGIDELVRSIAKIDEAEREKKMDSFYSQLPLWCKYFYYEGVRKQNPYLKYRSVMEAVFYASRYILEVNHLLFPCHKDLMKQVEKAENKPQGYIEQAIQLLENPTDERMEKFYHDFCEWCGPRIPYKEVCAQFIKDSEWNWIDGNPPLSDR